MYSIVSGISNNDKLKYLTIRQFFKMALFFL